MIKKSYANFYSDCMIANSDIGESMKILELFLQTSPRIVVSAWLTDHVRILLNQNGTL